MAVLWAALEYPLELVGVTGQSRSNMNPPSAMMVAQILVQFGLLVLVRPALNRWLERSRRAWRRVRAAGLAWFPVLAAVLAGLIAGFRRLAPVG